MSERKKGKSWAEMSGGEKKAVLVGWVVVAAILSWLFLPVSKDLPLEQPPTMTVPTDSSAHTYQTASPEALVAATAFVATIDKAVLDGAGILQDGDLATISKHSQVFVALMDSGRGQFGGSLFEPLGHCFAAGIHAQSWWMAQIHASSNGGVESVSGEVKSAHDEYQANRASCLKSADPIASAKSETELKTEIKEQLGGERECLTTFTVDPETKAVVAKPKPAHCHELKKQDG